MAAMMVNPFAADEDRRETLLYNPSVPLKQPMKINPYSMVYISGMPEPNSSRFNINFDCPARGFLAFHFDARINHSDRNTVVRNAKIGGSWGREEREQPCFPFEPNKFFEIVIMVYPTCYKVAVNNKNFVSFDHRIKDLSEVHRLRIKGDVRLFQVRIL